MTKLIPLTQNKHAIVDDEDYDFLMQWKWYAHRRHDGEFIAKTRSGKGKILMHRLIVNTPSDMQTDHIDGDTLNNRRSNLRICTNTQNSANRQKPQGAISQYKGIYRVGNRWKAVISPANKHICLGYFSTDIEAAKAYDKAAKQIYGEFARLNFPQESQRDVGPSAG